MIDTVNNKLSNYSIQFYGNIQNRSLNLFSRLNLDRQIRNDIFQIRNNIN